MPPLSAHQSTETTKLILMGDSGAGKTGALASLADAGFNLRILDLDNGLDVLFNLLTDPRSPYKNGGAERVHYKTLTDPMKQIAGKISAVRSVAWPAMTAMLEHWKEPDLKDKDGVIIQPAYDLGKPSAWGTNDILVVDSLTMAANAAMNWHLQMQGGLAGNTRTQNEIRRDIGATQAMVEKLLQLLYDNSLKCNVIVTSHITYTNEDGSTPSDGESKPQIGYPSAVGKALSPRIPRYFNSMLYIRTMGSGPSAKHQIMTHSMGTVAGKTPAPLKVKPSYPVEFGLAQYFKDLRS